MKLKQARNYTLAAFVYSNLVTIIIASFSKLLYLIFLRYCCLLYHKNMEVCCSSNSEFAGACAIFVYHGQCDGLLNG
jgi:hypothetical protein